MGPNADKSALSDALRIERKFKGLRPRCQTKNRIKSISLFDLGISNLLQDDDCCQSYRSKSLDRAGDSDLVRSVHAALVTNLGQATRNRVDLKDRHVIA